MKKNKIIALILAVMMVCLVAVGCGEAKQKIAVQATFSVIINGQTVIDSHTAEMKGTATSAPSVLEAVCDVLELYGIIPDYDEHSLIGANYNGVMYNTENGNAWYYTINGKDGSRASETILQEGDTIVYIYGPIA